MTVLAGAMEQARGFEPIAVRGEVASLRGLTLLVADLPVVVGSIVRVESAGGEKLGEVIGFDGRHAIVMMLGQASGIRGGDRVWSVESSPTVQVGASMLGRVIDGLGRPIDGGPALRETTPALIHPDPTTPLRRRRICEPLPTGVRAIDAMTPAGKGQRLGIFAGPGVGKSTLLSMIARNTSADVNVIALIGERGREVRDFIETALGPEGLARSVVVVSTSDESPLLRVRAAFVACTIAEHFQSRGDDVMLMVDSVTRFAHAQRQIGLSVGEPPATRGYTPSVFAMLPRLLERAGAQERSGAGTGGGTVTGFYTVLVEGDDMTEPVADAVRGILDGHVMLSRKLAQRAHYPAIDVLDSISRLADDVSAPEHAAARREVSKLLAAHRGVEELLQIGAYAGGSDAMADRAIALKPHIDALLQQPPDESTPFEVVTKRLREIAAAPGPSAKRGD